MLSIMEESGESLDIYNDFKNDFNYRKEIHLFM